MEARPERRNWFGFYEPFFGKPHVYWRLDSFFDALMLNEQLPFFNYGDTYEDHRTSQKCVNDEWE